MLHELVANPARSSCMPSRTRPIISVWGSPSVGDAETPSVETVSNGCFERRFDSIGPTGRAATI
jgi:hypothetical protein